MTSFELDRPSPSWKTLAPATSADSAGKFETTFWNPLRWSSDSEPGLSSAPPRSGAKSGAADRSPKVRWIVWPTAGRSRTAAINASPAAGRPPGDGEEVVGPEHADFASLSLPLGLGRMSRAPWNFVTAVPV